jgi:hypothetical protein
MVRKIHVGSRSIVRRVRYKDDRGIKSRLFLNISKCPPRVPGRVLRISKVDPDQINKTGAYALFPKVLMREFRNKGKRPMFDQKMGRIEQELKESEEKERELQINMETKGI